MKTMFRLWIIALLIVVACTSKNSTQQSIFKERDFTLQTIDDEEVTLSQFKGNVILIDFWATWCPPCVRAIPSNIRLYNKYHEQGFVILGISNEDKYLLRQYREENGVPYHILLGTNDVFRAYGVQGIPHMLIIDKKGVVRKTQTGYYPGLEPQIDALVDSLLKE
jgi:peroxiredoxin